MGLPPGEDAAWLGLLLAGLRWWALLQVQVLWRRTVGPWWTVASVGLAGVLVVGGVPGLGARAGVSAGIDPWSAAAAELALGALVGLVVAAPGFAVLGAADASARVLGTAAGPWRALALTLVAATALGLSLHRPLLLGAQEIFAVWPVGEPAAWWVPADVSSPARLAHGLALLALTLATPALLAGAVAELVVRAAGRGPTVAGPAIDALAPWLRVAAALVATGASWAAYDAAWAARALSGAG